MLWKSTIYLYIKDLTLRLDLKNGSFEDAMQAINNLIDNNIEFDGIFATNEWRAHGALVALQQHNISVPDKVKIVGYDGTYVSKYCNPPITTIYQDKKELAFIKEVTISKTCRAITYDRIGNLWGVSTNGKSVYKFLKTTLRY